MIRSAFLPALEREKHAMTGNFKVQLDSIWSKMSWSNNLLLLRVVVRLIPDSNMVSLTVPALALMWPHSQLLQLAKSAVKQIINSTIRVRFFQQQQSVSAPFGRRIESLSLRSSSAANPCLHFWHLPFALLRQGLAIHLAACCTVGYRWVEKAEGKKQAGGLI